MTWDTYGAKKQCFRETLPKRERKTIIAIVFMLLQYSNGFGKFLRHISSGSIRSTLKKKKKKKKIRRFTGISALVDNALFKRHTVQCYYRWLKLKNSDVDPNFLKVRGFGSAILAWKNP